MIGIGDTFAACARVLAPPGWNVEARRESLGGDMQLYLSRLEVFPEREVRAAWLRGDEGAFVEMIRERLYAAVRPAPKHTMHFRKFWRKAR